LLVEVGITNVEPGASVIRQNPIDLAKDFHETINVVFYLVFEAELRLVAIVTHCPIRRGCNYGIDRPLGEFCQAVERVPYM
jgi:hypothetical protein